MGNDKNRRKGRPINASRAGDGGNVIKRRGRPTNASRERRERLRHESAAAREGDGGSGGGGSSSRIKRDQAGAALQHRTVDLNSRAATNVANIVIRSAKQHEFPIIQFECLDCLMACEQIRAWLQSSGPPDIRTLIRVEDQKLNLLGPDTKGNITLLEGAATLEGDVSAPISILALHTPKDKHIRYFWTLLSPTPLLTNLTQQNLIRPPTIYRDGPVRYSPSGAMLPPRHHTLYTFLAQGFASATTFPDSPAYKQAFQISDVCPSILDPATAHGRIEANQELRPPHDAPVDGKDLGDDRYILELHPAERALASLVDSGCAEYLLIKRKYFKAFSRETILHAEKVRRAAAHNRNQGRNGTPANIEDGDIKTEDDNETEDADSLRDSTPRTTRSRGRSISTTPAPSVAARNSMAYHAARASAAQTGAINRKLRVRTNHAHVRTAEELSGWSFTRAKKLIIGWDMLGFLNEERILAVLEGQDDGGSENEDDE